jgi:tetratricopeptide (TPR) repeat protein
MRERKTGRRQGKLPMHMIIVMVLVPLMISSCTGFMIGGKAKYAYEQGFAFFNEGRFTEAIPYFEEALSLEPDFYSAHLYLGRSHLNLHNYGKALPSLRKAYRLSPQDFQKQVMDILVDALMGAAFSELKEGNFQASLNYVREILSVEPRSQKIKDDLSRVLVTIATELFKSGKVREAIKEYTEAIKINPDNSSAYMGLARALFKNGDFMKALDAAQNALSLDPDSKEALGLIKEFLKK